MTEPKDPSGTPERTDEQKLTEDTGEKTYSFSDPEPAKAEPKKRYCVKCGLDQSSMPDNEPCPRCALGHATPVCTFCQYQLIGLKVEDNCPECGKPIWDSNLQLPTSGFSITSMVLGIVSIISCMIYGIPSVILGPLAMIFAYLANEQFRKGDRAGATRGFAKTGMICGAVGLVLGMVYISVIAIFISRF